MMAAAQSRARTGGAMPDSAEDVVSDDLRQRVLIAAHDELTRWGIDRFSIVALADRHDLDPGIIAQRWSSEEQLILDVLIDEQRTNIPAPDTGTLRTDLLALARAMADYVSSDAGRSLQATHLIGNRSLPTAEIRRTVWRARSSRLHIVFDRARDRGELVDDVDPPTAMELLLAPINMRALFTGEPIDDQYCQTVADLVWRAIAV